MTDFNYADWVEGTYQTCNDPTEWNGTNPKCAIDCCENEIAMHDDYCDDHQRCIMCGDNEDCICEKEWGNVSNCCEATFYEPGYPDNDICSACGEHSTSAWQDAVDNCKNN